MADNEKTRNPPRAQRGVWFGFVAQADISEQMDVVRWLRTDTRYRVVTILHNKDTYEEDSTITRDGAEVAVKKGDRKSDHFHGIVRVGSKITAQSLAKRFGAYLHFELLSDPAEYAMYMLHQTFNAREKAKYDYSELLDDVALWDEITEKEREDDVCAVVRKVASYRTDSGEISVDDMLTASDAVALRSLMGHSYFYKTFVDKSEKGGSKDGRNHRS